MINSFLSNQTDFRIEKDVGGQDQIRPLWRHYFTGTQALIYVVDSADRSRISESKQELNRILSDREMKRCIVLVFANKQDTEGALSAQEVTRELDLDTVASGRPWTVMSSNAKTGEGLAEGLTWIKEKMPKGEDR